jgi:hypothetical protein
VSRVSHGVPSISYSLEIFRAHIEETICKGRGSLGTRDTETRANPCRCSPSVAGPGRLHGPQTDASLWTVFLPPPNDDALRASQVVPRSPESSGRRRFIAPVREFFHSLPVWHGQHERFHRGFILPGRPCPKCSILLAQQTHSEVSGSSLGLPCRPKSKQNKAEKVYEPTDAQTSNGNESHTGFLYYKTIISETSVFVTGDLAVRSSSFVPYSGNISPSIRS